jgi:AAA domain/Bifunctional DNA primase/polymerase, N-terminal
MTATEIRLALRANGYSPIPVLGKRPLITEWQKKVGAPATEIAGWAVQYQAMVSTGILTAHTPAIDTDVLITPAAAAVEDLLRDHFDGRGTLLCRFGNAPKRALLFRTSNPFGKIAAHFKAPDGSFQKVEILGDGQQLVVDGIHPEIGQPYRWARDQSPTTVPWTDLPELDEAEAREILELISNMLCEQFGFEHVATTISNGAGGYAADMTPATPDLSYLGVDVDAALAGICYGNIHDTWRACVGSLLRKGMRADDIYRRVLSATEGSPACQADPKKKLWGRGILDMLQSYVRHERAFIANLSPEMQKVWHKHDRAGTKVQFVFRDDLGLHIRAAHNQGQQPWEQPQPPPLNQPADQPGKHPKKYRFKLVSFADMRPGPEPLYLVDELIPVAGLVDVWGKAKCFKSFWCLDLMLHVAMGWEYRDRYVKQGAVVYLAFEGGHGYKKRIEALRRHYQIANDATVPLYVMPGQANLIAEHTVLIGDIAEQLGETRPSAVVLDTLNKSLHGSENKDTDMGAYVRAAEAVRDAFQCVVIIIHHCGYDDTRPRGHSSLPGAVDAQLAVVREGTMVTVTVEMMRDGVEETVVTGEVKTVEVGHDQNGKVLTSLVMVATDAPAAGTNYDKLPTSLKVFYRAMREALRSDGEPFQPDTFEAPIQAVDQEAVRKAFYAGYATEGESSQQQQEARKKAFRRSLDAAQKTAVMARVLDTGKTMLWFRPGDPD